jgi:hypothetical protein
LSTEITENILSGYCRRAGSHARKAFDYREREIVYIYVVV